MKPEVNKTYFYSRLETGPRVCQVRVHAVTETMAVISEVSGYKEFAVYLEDSKFEQIKTQQQKLAEDLLTAPQPIWKEPLTAAAHLIGLGWKKEPCRPIVDFHQLRAEFNKHRPDDRAYALSDFLDFLNSTVVAYRK